ncbi:MAG: amidase [Streptosporangiaceae bacterium]|jgi:amidase
MDPIWHLMDPIWIVRVDAPGDGPRLAVKDCIDVAGLPTTVGCQAIAEQAAPASRDAAVVATARRSGARIVGKTNLTELCWSAAGINPWSGTPPNPLDFRRVPGGSSSGSAVAVATGQADIALGTDTAGSVRIPAACCGVVGLKTTWGRVPSDGVYPLAPSMDTVGLLGRDVSAVEAGMRLIEPRFAVRSCELAAGRLRPSPVDPLVDRAVDAALAAAGVRTADVAGLDLSAARGAADVIIDAEAYRANEYLMPQLGRLSPRIQRNMTESAAITAAELAAANSTRQAVRDWFTDVLARHPFVALPTLVGPPPLLGQRGMSLTVLTAPANLAGLPALALPVPGGPAGLSASLQLVGSPGTEEQLLHLGRIVEVGVGKNGDR